MFVSRFSSFMLQNVSVISRNFIPRERVIVLSVLAYHRSYSKRTEDQVSAPTSTDAATDSDTAATDLDIAHQKGRAIQYWNESKWKHAEALKDQVHDDVMQHLQEGKVLPIFHTLCRPPTERLFSPNTRVSLDDPKSDIIQLSSDPVTMGKCDEDSESVGKLSMKAERSYLTSFFNNRAANFIVKDMSFNWEFDDDYTKIITDLINAPADMIGEDLELTELVEPFDVDKVNGRNLITRRLSRGVVADGFAKSKAGSTYAIVGNPGIGKSWTLIYALQQALLYENACVLLCFQKKGIATVCLRRNNKIYVWRSKHPSFGINLDSLLFQNSNLLVLLDPLESSKGGASYMEGERMLLFAASNNKIHFKSIGKFTGDYAIFLSCCSDKELKISLKHMIVEEKASLSMVLMIERASKVGNLPRYILSETLFERRLKQTEEAIDELKYNKVEEIYTFDGISRIGSTIPGSIYAVNAYIDDDLSYTHEKIGYDGHLVLDYGRVQLSFISQSVRADLLKSNRKFILSYWRKVQSSAKIQMANLVEDLLWNDLREKFLMKVFSFKKSRKAATSTDNAEQREGDDESDEMDGDMAQLDVGMYNSTYHEDVSLKQLGPLIFASESPNICRMKERAALVDFAGPFSRVYQVTTGDDHDLSKEGLKALFISSGHCKMHENGTIFESESAKTIRKISFYWLVPRGMLSKWRKRVPKTIYDKDDENVKELKNCLDKYVEQRILVLYDDPIRAKKVTRKKAE